MLEIENLNPDKCNGCAACFNACPVGAITMERNEEGFLFPKINYEKCIKCGLCTRTCSYLNAEFENVSEPEAYAVMADDDIRLAGSSSGGVFYVIARRFIEDGGYVVGAAFEGVKVKHCIVDNLNDLEKLKGSKYVQSEIGDIYKQVKILLDKNAKVFFTGTPCQAAGLKQFLGKDYYNLFMADIICHGVPSPKVFEKYIDEITPAGSKFVGINFRTKSGKNNQYFCTTTITTTTYRDCYMQAFLQNLSLRKSCGCCPFQTIPRQGDLTLGDFWGSNNFDPALDDGKGLSAVLINNEKGKEILAKVSEQFIYCKEVPLKYVVDGNPVLKRPFCLNNNRKLFFYMINDYTLEDTASFCLGKKFDYLIVNFWYSLNYGAALTAWALQEMVKSLGFKPMILNDRDPKWLEKAFKDSFSYKFAEEFLYLSPLCNTRPEQESLCQNIKGVILGSDQVLRIKYMLYNGFNTYLLNFVPDTVRKIAWSASFGLEKKKFLKDKKIPNFMFEYIKKALNTFDYLSTREISGREVFKDIFGLDSDFVLDPVFLIDREHYKIVTDSSNAVPVKNLSYILDKTKQYDKVYKNLGDVTEIVKGIPVKDWLKMYETAEFIITDSYHGTCLALIFNKPFVCVYNKERGGARFDTLIKLFNIDKHFVNSSKELFSIKPEDYVPDWNYINSVISDERERCLKIFEKVLTEDFSNNPNLEDKRRDKALYYKSLSKNWQVKYRLFFYKLMFNLTFKGWRKCFLAKKKIIKEIVN